jgi:hypothetical protein
MTPLHQPATTSRLRLALVLLIGSLSAVIALGLGGVAAAFTMLQQRAIPIPQLLSADTQLYATLTPGLDTLPHLEALRRAFPELLDYAADPTTAQSLAELLGVNVATDVAPWVGGEGALALRGLPLDALDTLSDLPDLLAQPDGGQMVILIAVRDRGRAQAFLDKQRAYREGQGAVFRHSEAVGVSIYADERATKSPITAFAIVRGYMVFASDADAIAALAARDPRGDDTLSASPHFAAVVEALPAERLGFLYMPGLAASALLRAGGQQLSNLHGACLCAQQILSLADRAETMHGVGLSLTAQEAGLRFDLTTVLDRALISDENFAALTAPVEPVAAAWAGELSSAARGAWSLRIPDDFGARYRQAVDNLPGGAAQLAAVEEALNIDLEADLLSWLRGEAALAYFPGDAQTATPFGLRMHVADRSAAERGLSAIFVGLANAYGLDAGPTPVQIGANLYQAIDTPDGRLGYSLSGDELTIALGEPALAAMTAPEELLMENAGYQATLAALPSPNGGVIYLGIGELRAVLESVGDDGAAAAARLAPFRAVVAAGAPGTDAAGVARASLIFTLASE